MATCFHHTERDTGRSCTRCGRPACWECLRDAAVGAHCFECIRAARPPAVVRINRWQKGEGLAVTKALIGINVAIYAAGAVLQNQTIRSGQSLDQLLGLHALFVADGDWFRLASSGFLHFSIFHIGFNMLAAYRLGEMLEPTLGRLRFAALWFGALLAGSLGALLLEPNAFTGGASGAVFGLFGAAAAGMRSRGINVWQSGIGPIIAVNLVITFAVPGISKGGHLGGLIGGAVIGYAMLSPRKNRSLGLEVAFGVAALSVVAGIWLARNWATAHGFVL